MRPDPANPEAIMTIDQAAEMLGAQHRLLQPFAVADPFHDGLPLEARNVRISDEQLSGTEGAVWCVTEPSGLVSLWKCKPESIEEIHWATGINKQAVLATCWNALETVDELSFDTVRPLLLEEYPPEDIDAFRQHVEECITAVRAELDFRGRVVAAYEAIQAEGLSFPADKAAVMRPGVISAMRCLALTSDRIPQVATHSSLDHEKHPANRKALPAEDRDQGQAVPLRHLPQAEPAAGKDARTVVLPAVRGGEGGGFSGHCREPRCGEPGPTRRRRYTRFIRVIESCSTVAIETQTK
jgi:hypothetical protein